MDNMHAAKLELQAAKRSVNFFLFCVFLFSVFVNLLMLTGPLFMLQVYDRVLSSHSKATLVTLFILVGLLYTFMGLMDYARGRILARAGARFGEKLSNRVFDATMRKGLHDTPELRVQTGLRDLSNIQSAFASPGFTALFDIPWVPIYFAAIFLFHHLLGWLGIAGGITLITFTALNQIFSKKQVLNAQSQSLRALNYADDIRRKGEIVRALGMLKSVQQRWWDKNLSSQQAMISSSDISGSFSTLTKTFRLFLQSAMLAAGAWLVLENELTPGAMIAGSIILGRALAPIEQSLGQWPMLQKSMASWQEIKKLLAQIPRETDVVKLPRPAAKMSIHNASVYPPGAARATLLGVSLTIEPGEVVGIIGESGSGKSTLARIMTGIWPVSNGKVSFDNAELAQYDSDTLGSYIGFLPQDVTLFDGSVAENISRMSLSPDSKDIIDAAKAALAHEIILTFPKGYNTQIGPNGVQLSGGQKQRIGLARALYGNPELIILDEPNSALDADGSNALNAVVLRLKNEGKAIIIMSHRPSAIAECSRLAILNQGQLIADGPKDEVLAAMASSPNSGE